MNIYGWHQIEKINNFLQKKIPSISVSLAQDRNKLFFKGGKFSCISVSPTQMCGSLFIDDIIRFPSDNEVANRLLTAIKLFCRLCGYTQLLCYYSEQENESSIYKFLQKNQFKNLEIIKNKRTGNTVHLMSFVFPEEQEPESCWLEYFEDNFKKQLFLLDKEIPNEI